MNLNKVKSFAPATVSNLNCGFDILGAAVNGLGDTVIITPNTSNIITLSVVSTSDELNNLAPEKNVAYAMVKLYLQKINVQQGMHIELVKNMPLNSGLGSSAASTVAALVAINKMFADKLSNAELLGLAVEGEKIACGNAHADNVAPCLYGGITLINSMEPIQTINLPVIKNLHFAIIHPHINVPTKESRAILKTEVPLKLMVQQNASMASFVAALFKKDKVLLQTALKDFIIEPQRAHLIPQFYTMQKKALKAGALAFGISGSGPTVFALCATQKKATKVSNDLTKIMQQQNIEVTAMVSAINMQGATATIF